MTRYHPTPFWMRLFVALCFLGHALCLAQTTTTPTTTNNSWELGPFPPDPTNDTSSSPPSSSSLYDGKANNNHHYDEPDYELPEDSYPSSSSTPCTHHQGVRNAPSDHHNDCSLQYNPKPPVVAVITVISFLWVVGTCCISICLSVRLVMPLPDGMTFVSDDDEPTVASISDYNDHDDEENGYHTDQEQPTSTTTAAAAQKHHREHETVITTMEECDATSDSEVSSS